MTIQDCPILSFFALFAEATALAGAAFLILGFLFLGGKDFIMEVLGYD